MPRTIGPTHFLMHACGRRLEDKAAKRSPPGLGFRRRRRRGELAGRSADDPVDRVAALGAGGAAAFATRCGFGCGAGERGGAGDGVDQPGVPEGARRGPGRRGVGLRSLCQATNDRRRARAGGGG